MICERGFVTVVEVAGAVEVGMDGTAEAGVSGTMAQRAPGSPLPGETGGFGASSD